MAHDFEIQLNKLQKVVQQLPPKMGADAVLFSKERFRQQNWIDNSTYPWRTKSRNRGGRGILILSGRLMRSIRKISVTQERIIIGSDVPYAKAHNEGFRGVVQVKAHTRGQYSRSRKGSGLYSVRTRKERTKTVTEKTGAIEVKAHSRRMNLHKNRFMGNSAYLGARLIRLAEADFNRTLN